MGKCALEQCMPDRNKEGQGVGGEWDIILTVPISLARLHIRRIQLLNSH